MFLGKYQLGIVADVCRRMMAPGGKGQRLVGKKLRGADSDLGPAAWHVARPATAHLASDRIDNQKAGTRVISSITP